MYRKLRWSCFLLGLFIIWCFFTSMITELKCRRNNDEENILEQVEMLKWYSERNDESNRLQETAEEGFLKPLFTIYKNNNTKFAPNLLYENLRRRLYLNVHELWYFVNAQISQINKRFRKIVAVKKNMTNFLNTFGEYKRSLINDINYLAEVDGFREWRWNENKKLSNLVQKRLHYIQNPEDCKIAKKITCELNETCGFGCQLHHLVDCFIMAYGTERTLIFESQKWWQYGETNWEEIFLPLSNTCTTNDGVTYGRWPDNPNAQVVFYPYTPRIKRPQFLPLNIPEDLSERLMRIHGDPIVWWVGQFFKYLLRPQPKIQRMLIKHEYKIKFKKPIVGIHIRRTDKIGVEASNHSLEEYMVHVEEYYKSLQTRQSVPQKRIYIATDDPTIFQEISSKYPDYEVIGDVRISYSAAVKNRDSKQSLKGILIDIHFLSKTDYLVCTFSSRVCRIAYEIMNSFQYDASQRYHSLDDIYYYAGQDGRYQTVVRDHRANCDEEIDLEIGDIVVVAGNHWDGYSKGTNTRTFKTGLYPSFKVIPKVEVAAFPTYYGVSEE